MSEIESLHLRFPFEYIALARGFEPGKHNGVDMGWHSSQGGKYIPCFAPADGTVVAVVDGKENNTKNASDYGNYIKIQHTDTIYTLMAHLKKDSIKVKVGDKVVRHQQLANMGNTGYSFGNHCHYEVFLGGSGNSYKVDPLLYTYAYEADVVGATTAKTYPIKFYVPTPTPDPVEEEEDEGILLEVFVLRKEDFCIKKIGEAYPGNTVIIPKI